MAGTANIDFHGRTPLSIHRTDISAQFVDRCGRDFFDTEGGEGAGWLAGRFEGRQWMVSVWKRAV